jgi:glycerol-3-phosphate dehydrogenase
VYRPTDQSVPWSTVAPPPFDRRNSLERLAADSFDVLVIGGGVTGCGVALDAATRGLRTALVEGRDFASGTSSKSSKMVHGGLRYLQQHDYLLVYEALHERQRLLTNAPHLVHPLPFLIPLFGRDGALAEGVAKAYSVALWLYDVTGGVRIGRRHRRIDASETLSHFPDLLTDRLIASFLYWDAQADDARLTLALARTAASRGAALANYAPVDALIEKGNRVTGARLVDGTEIRADAVVNAGGVWSEEVARHAGPGSAIPVSIRPAKGIHLAVPSERLPCDYAAVLAVPGDKRSIFVVPWAADEAPGPAAPGRYTYLGTTDTDYYGPLDDPQCTPDDVEYILKAVNHWTSAGLTPSDVTGTWAGLRPLISDAHSARTADLSRRHRVITSPNGLVTVTGGKLTTYRIMAADTVDAVKDHLAGPGRFGRLSRVSRNARARLRRPGRGPTRRLVLVGGEDGGKPAASVVEAARRAGLSGEVIGHLAGRHGTETSHVVALLEADPTLAEPLVAGLPYIKAEAVYAARHEMVHTLGDLLSRRTRALILDRAATLQAAPVAAALIAPELGWDTEERERQVAQFRADAKAEDTAMSSSASPVSTTSPVSR